MLIRTTSTTTITVALQGTTKTAPRTLVLSGSVHRRLAR
jgi:hypothetical protein